jgi:hypothetical protein
MIWRREKSVMRKSDPTITKNVIPFPKRPKNRSSAAMASSPQSVGQTAGYRHYKSSSPFQPPLKPTAALRRPNPVHQQLALLAMSLKGNPTPELIDEMAPGLVRSILRRAGTGDTGKAELPKHLKRRLDLMCHFKHPAALIINDWLDGNRRFLPANIQTIADYSTCARAQK